MQLTDRPQIVVIGLGYVGLPLAVALAEHFDTIGFDIDSSRIAELREGQDRTNEIAQPSASPDRRCGLTDRARKRPAPISTSSPSRRRWTARIGPISAPLLARDRTGRRADRRPADPRPSSTKAPSIPGVTEEICGPLIERVSGLVRGPRFLPRLLARADQSGRPRAQHRADRKGGRGRERGRHRATGRGLWPDHLGRRRSAPGRSRPPRRPR